MLNYFIERMDCSGEIISHAVVIESRGRTHSVLFSGETFGIPINKRLEFLGDVDDIDRRVREHMEYICGELVSHD